MADTRLRKTAWYGLFALVVASAPLTAVQAGEVYRLTASDVVIENPSPLFTSSAITGTLTLADSVGPGMSFGALSVIAAAFDFAGIMGGLSAIQADIAPGPVQVFGMRSVDGLSLSMLDLRFGFDPSTPGCSFFCAGQIILNSGFDPSNFIAADDLAGDTLSVIDSFTPSFALVPEPTSLLTLSAGLLALARVRRADRARH